MSAGTFNVARSVWDHPVFRKAVFSEREAFLWMVSEAAWKPHKARSGAYVIDIERGQLCHSVRFMAKAWGWTPARVFRFLDKIRDENMIEKRNSSETAPNVISICNYEKYQGPRNSADGKPEQQRNSSETNYKKVIREEEKDTSDEVSKARKRAPDLVSLFPPLVSRDRAIAFVAHRNAMKRSLTPHAITLLGKSLVECEAMGISADAAIDLAIDRGWQTVKPDWAANALTPKAGGPGNGQSPRKTFRQEADAARIDGLLAAAERWSPCGSPGGSEGDHEPAEDRGQNYLPQGRLRIATSG